MNCIDAIYETNKVEAVTELNKPEEYKHASNCNKSFIIKDTRMLISLLLNSKNQQEITKIMRTGVYDSLEHFITLDMYNEIKYNGNKYH